VRAGEEKEPLWLLFLFWPVVGDDGSPAEIAFDVSTSTSLRKSVERGQTPLVGSFSSFLRR